MPVAALILIAAATAAASATGVAAPPASQGELLLFLYAEILAMIKAYTLGNRELPARTPATTGAVARYRIPGLERLEPTWRQVGSVAIFLLTLALQVIH